MSHTHPHVPSRLSGVWILLGLVLTGGLDVNCSRSGGGDRRDVLIFGLDDRTSKVPQGVSFDLEEARSMLEDAIDRSGRLRLISEKKATAYRAELTIVLASERESQRSDDDGVYRTVHVDLTLSRWVKDGVSDTVSAQGKAFLVQDPGSISREEGFTQLLQQAIQKSVAFVDLQLKGRSMTTDELQAWLVSEQTENRLYVLRTLRERMNPELVPRVIELLSDPDPDVVMEAVGVLVAQKDQRAVQPLIRMTERRDNLFLFQIITALGEIKGPVARGYLFTLAAGHVSAAIRERAREALSQISRLDRSADSGSQERAVALPRTQQGDPRPQRQGAP